MALPTIISPFRLAGSGRGNDGGDSFWLPDGMGGGVDPSDPQLGRRDFLLRAAIAAVSLAVGTAVHVVALALARDSLAARAPESSEAETLTGGRP